MKTFDNYDDEELQELLDDTFLALQLKIGKDDVAQENLTDLLEIERELTRRETC